MRICVLRTLFVSQCLIANANFNRTGINLQLQLRILVVSKLSSRYFLREEHVRVCPRPVVRPSMCLCLCAFIFPFLSLPFTFPSLPFSFSSSFSLQIFPFFQILSFPFVHYFFSFFLLPFFLPFFLPLFLPFFPFSLFLSLSLVFFFLSLSLSRVLSLSFFLFLLFFLFLPFNLCFPPHSYNALRTRFDFRLDAGTCMVMIC